MTLIENTPICLAFSRLPAPGRLIKGGSLFCMMLRHEILLRIAGMFRSGRSNGPMDILTFLSHKVCMWSRIKDLCFVSLPHSQSR